MKVLIAHIAYEQRGGEDVVVETEARLLREAGHDVSLLVVSSSRFRDLSRFEQTRIALRMDDHTYGRALIRAAIEEHRPEIVHFHNLYPLLGPGAIAEAASLGCATVQTFHNYRLSCIAGTHFRNGEVCERCRPGHHGAGVARGCYRGSRMQSLAMACGVTQQWRCLIKEGLPHVALCLTDFMRDRLIGLSAPGDALVVKPNSVEVGGRAGWDNRAGVVFVGRLSEEKGIAELLDRWTRDMPELRVIGDGPLYHLVRQRCDERPNVRLVGRLDAEGVRKEIACARALVFPSRCWEGLPLVVLEALAEGTPVVAFALGAMTLLEQVSPELLVSYELGAAALGGAAARVCLLPGTRWAELSSRVVGLHEVAYSHEASIGALEAVYAGLVFRGADHV